MKDNAAAAATTLTIRHSRFATLTLAKLVASLALHPPISATGSGGLRASSVRTSLTASPQGEAFGRSHFPICVKDYVPLIRLAAARHLPPFWGRLL